MEFCESDLRMTKPALTCGQQEGNSWWFRYITAGSEHNYLIRRRIQVTNAVGSLISQLTRVQIQ